MDLAAAAGDRDDGEWFCTGRCVPGRLRHGPDFHVPGLFQFNKQAFCNYYYLVIATACWSIAAARIPRHRPAADAIRGLASPV